MAITIDWKTHIINIPRNDMTLVQVSPTEIRELDTNFFRLRLKELEWEFYGMVNLVTHIHNPPLNIGGLELARTVEILAPYTITFEDGQYAVNLVGSNNNILPRTNKNQVSINPSNSAGLVTSSAIEFGEYQGRVTFDPLNRTGKSISGSIYPIGTLRVPVDNIQDAVVIAESRGFTEIYFISNYTLTTGDNLPNLILSGINSTQTYLTVETGADVLNCEFRNMTIDGVLDGGSTIRDCDIGDLTYFNGQIHHSMINTNITLGGGTSATIHGCFSGVPGSATPTINMGGTGQSLGLRAYSGGIEIINKTGPDGVSLDFVSGHAIIDSSVLDGQFVIRGNCKITDKSALGEKIDREAVVLPEVAYNGEITLHPQTGGTGQVFPFGTATYPIASNEDAVAISRKYNIFKFVIKGTLSTDRDFTGAIVRGEGAVQSNVVLLNGYNYTDTVWTRLTLTGVLLGTDQQYEECILSNIDGLGGLAKECAFIGTDILNDDLKITCASFVSQPTILDMGTDTNYFLQLQASAGILQINNHSTNNVSRVTFQSGELIIGASCTGGTIYVQGDTKIEDNSGGAVTIIRQTTAENVWAYER